MKPILMAIALILAAPAVAAEDPGFAPLDAANVTLSDFLWQRRPVVVFADSPADPAFAEQMALLESRWPELAERDVIVITDTEPQAEGDIRQKLRPRGFALVLIGKDGNVELRKPSPWDVRELTRAIDKMPMRREEIRAKRLGN
jgi:hypothetical protein